MTSLELADELDKYLGHEKYAKAMADNLLTTAEINKQANRSGSVGDWYKQTSKQDKTKTNKQYLLQFADKGWYGADCVGAIKGILFFGNKFGGPSNSPDYSSDKDMSIKTMASKCTDKKTKADFSKAEVGEFMWTDDYGHCALVTVAGKKDTECAPSLDGLGQVDLDYQPNWAGCGKLPWVTYSSQPAPAPLVKAGDVVTICKGAVYGGSAKGTPVPSAYCDKPYRVGKTQVVKNEYCALITELNSWVPARYLTVVSQAEAIKAGCCVKIGAGAVYGGSAKGVKVPSCYINTNSYVVKVASHNGTREALLKNLNSWVPLKYLTLVR